jgi:hypothetical protein
MLISDCGNATATAPNNTDPNPSYDANPHVIGTIATYSCMTGYAPLNSPTVECLNTAAWSIASFQCVGKYTGHQLMTITYS